MIYNGLMDIADKFDLFLFDAYGVFWEGKGFYLNSRETMAELVRQGKTVVIVSNTTQLHDDAVEAYIKRGLQPDEHYSYLMTSGDLLQKRLREGSISFESCPQPQTYYVIGYPHFKAFAGSKYQQVSSLNEADFVYCGVPYVTAEMAEQYPQYQQDYLPVEQGEDGKIWLWDTLNAAPFVEIVEQAVALKKPALNANPDFTAKEGHKLAPEAPSGFVVRNGTIAEMFRNRGAEVLEFGKPHLNIYEYVFEILAEQGIMVDKARTCMIGDTVRTDIKGAVNVGVTPVLCVDTGVTALEIEKGNTIKSLCNAENVDVKHVVQICSVGGKGNGI